LLACGRAREHRRPTRARASQIPQPCLPFFTQPIVVLNQAALSRPPWNMAPRDAAQMINNMGNRSAAAQGLMGPGNRPNPITQAHTLGETSARLYLLAQPGPTGAPVLVGLLKVGLKTLFYWDAHGKTSELREQRCVLDFYVHEQCQRGGLGKVLFTAMLNHEDMSPELFAYDRPSPKLLGFLRKHYQLASFVPQQNKFVIFNQFFTGKPTALPSIYDSVQDRPLTARGGRGGRVR
jgi:hypothetical protein